MKYLLILLFAIATYGQSLSLDPTPSTGNAFTKPLLKDATNAAAFRSAIGAERNAAGTVEITNGVLDFSLGRTFAITLTSDVALAYTNMADGDWAKIRATSIGTNSLTFPDGTVFWPAVPSQTPNGTDLYLVEYEAGATNGWHEALPVFEIGDLLIASTTNRLERLPIGAEGTVLTSSSGRPAYTATEQSIRLATPGGGVFLNANVSGTKITGTLSNNIVVQNIGTNNRSIWVKFRMPTTAGNYGLAQFSSIATGSGAYGFEVKLTSAGAIAVVQYGSSTSNSRTHTTATTMFSQHGGKIVDVHVSTLGTTVNVWVNSVLTSTTATTSGTAPATTDAIDSTYFNIGIATAAQIFPGEIYQAVPFIGALSQTDVNDMVRTGSVPWAIRNGSMNTYTADFSVGTDSFSNLAGAVLTGNIDGITDGTTSKDNVMRIYADGTTGVHAIRRVTLFPQAYARYTISYDYYMPSGNTTVKRWQSNILQVPQTNSVTGAWTSVTHTNQVPTDPGFYITLYNAAGASSFTGANSTTDDVVYIANLRVIREGSPAWPKLDQGIGYHFADQSNNRIDFISPADAGVVHISPMVHGDFVVTRTFTNTISASAGTTQFFHLPPNCSLQEFEIDREVAFTASTTLDIGTSGTAAKYVSAQALDATGKVRVASSSLVSESSTASTIVYVKVNAAASVGKVTIRAVIRSRGL